jgi:hypothetical protein
VAWIDALLKRRGIDDCFQVHQPSLVGPTKRDAGIATVAGIDTGCTPMDAPPTRGRYSRTRRSIAGLERSALQ